MSPYSAGACSDGSGSARRAASGRTAPGRGCPAASRTSAIRLFRVGACGSRAAVRGERCEGHRQPSSSSATRPRAVCTAIVGCRRRAANRRASPGSSSSPKPCSTSQLTQTSAPVVNDRAEHHVLREDASPSPSPGTSTMYCVLTPAERDVDDPPGAEHVAVRPRRRRLAVQQRSFSGRTPTVTSPGVTLRALVRHRDAAAGDVDGDQPRRSCRLTSPVNRFDWPRKFATNAVRGSS